MKHNNQLNLTSTALLVLRFHATLAQNNQLRSGSLAGRYVLNGIKNDWRSYNQKLWRSITFNKGVSNILWRRKHWWKEKSWLFSQFIQNHENGILHLYKVAHKAIGFSTVYKGFSSTRSEQVAILNDLYIQPSHRRNGYAKKLINNALKTTKSMGVSRLQWLTAEDNKAAQKVYNNIGANQSKWFFYAKET